MTNIKPLRERSELDQLAKVGASTLYPDQVKIIVGTATCGQAAGANEVLDAIRDEVAHLDLPYQISQTGCIGWCSQEPLVDVWSPGKPRFSYGRMTPEKARKLVRAISTEIAMDCALTFMTGDRNSLDDSVHTYCTDGAIDGLIPFEQLPLFKNQLRIVLRNCGFINPQSIEEYMARGGYRALWDALRGMRPQEIIWQVTNSGLRGRGGAGFPTGQKWLTMSQQTADQKYVICNADEGDPGAYMDRAVLEGDPHTVVEGMIIGGYAMGASEGIIYVREEYPLAITRLVQAIEEAEHFGLLGDDIVGSGFSFHIWIAKGAGAFVCGEETALIHAIEGRVGEPRQRPPFPAKEGLWRKPTCINNVETWANIPVIIERGGGWFASIGTIGSKGTKVFSLVGNINNTALIEVPMGTTLRQIVYDIGGGIPKGSACKAVQTGGPSGGCIPAHLLDARVAFESLILPELPAAMKLLTNMLDLPVDYETLKQAGSIMGSGGMIVMDEHTCMVDIARYFLGFLEDESCGKCFSCRVGTQRLKEIVDRIACGKGKPGDLELLDDLGWLVKEASMCGLGQTAANPVLSTLRYFKDEYRAHIEERRCPAKVCRELITFELDPVKCNGCGACVQVCSGQSILGEKNKLHRIEQANCTKCGACLESCKFDAVLVN